MQSNYKTCLDFVLKSEGGYVNHPKDPGGATNKGVTQKVYDAFRQSNGQVAKDVKLISAAEVQAIYKEQYWDRIRGNDLPSGIDLACMDYAVNSGPQKAVKDLQRALVLPVIDGVIGAMTLQAVNAADEAKLINALCDRRLRFMKSLKGWATFGRGWFARVEACRAAGVALVQPDAPPAPTPTEAPAKAIVADQAKMKTADGVGLTAAAAGAGGQTIMSFAQQVQPHIGQTVLGRAALVVFLGLAVIGGILIAYSYLKRIREAGGLSGFLGGVLRA